MVRANRSGKADLLVCPDGSDHVRRAVVMKGLDETVPLSTNIPAVDIPDVGSQLADRCWNIDSNLGKSPLAETDPVTVAGNEIDQPLETLHAVHDPGTSHENIQGWIIRVHRECNSLSFGLGNHRRKEILQVLPQLVCGYFPVFQLAGCIIQRDGLVHRREIKPGNPGASPFRFIDRGPDPVCTGHEVVTEHRDLQFTHDLEKLLDRFDLLVASLGSHDDLVSLESILDSTDLQAMAFHLLPGR